MHLIGPKVKPSNEIKVFLHVLELFRATGLRVLLKTDIFQRLSDATASFLRIGRVWNIDLV